MAFRVQVDLPAVGESLTLGDLAALVHQARSVGANNATPVSVLGEASSDEIAAGLSVELPDARHRHHEVSVDASTMSYLLRVLEAITHDEGDVRRHLGDIDELHSSLLEACLHVGEL